MILLLQGILWKKKVIMGEYVGLGFSREAMPSCVTDKCGLSKGGGEGGVLYA